ncbi:MAG: hypothetical protein P4L84_31385 [Isosphaeraceae bacterium]|nr:hypothetical protein [Isosphaeraceae bacterium]
MIPPFGRVVGSLVDDVEDRVRHRAKATAQPLGASRFRLIGLIRRLGVYNERISAWMRAERQLDERLEEQRAARLKELQRIVKVRDEARAARLRTVQRLAWHVRRQRLSRLWEHERAALALEQRGFVLILKEELAWQAMTPEQAMADRMEEQVIGWLTAGDPEALR